MKLLSKVSIQAIPMLCILLGLTSSGMSYAAEFNPSWSLDYVIEPKQQQISGVPLLKIDAELTHIEFINCEHQSLSIKQCNQIAEFGGELEMLLDMNQDGQPEIWRIGVAKLLSGDYAKVLVIQDAFSNEVVQTFIVESAQPGFSTLHFSQGQVRWAMCLSCDVMADVEWNNGEYHMRWQPNFYVSADEEVVVNNAVINADGWE